MSVLYGRKYIMNEVDEELTFDDKGNSQSMNNFGYLNPLAPSENVACWIHGNSFTWALLVPTMVLYAFSIAVFSRIAFVLTKSIDAIPRDQKARHRTMTTTVFKKNRKKSENYNFL